MALMPCRECKRDVSTEAKACPHCGVKSPTKAPPSAKEGIAGLAILVLLAGVGISMCSRQDAESNPSASAPTTTPVASTKDSGTGLKEAPAATLGLTPKAYADRANAEFVKLGMDLRFPSRIDLLKGDSRNSFNVELAPFMHVIGMVDTASGEVMDVTLLGAGGQGTEAAATFLATAVVVSKAAVTDDGLAKKVGQQVGDFLLNKRADQEVVTKVLGRVKLYHVRDPNMGIWFGAAAL